MHTCFPQCKTNADCYLGFNVDTREKCLVGEITGKGEEEGILCVSSDTVCETLVSSNEICLNADNTFCISWSNIWISIMILNCV